MNKVSQLGLKLGLSMGIILGLICHLGGLNFMLLAGLISGLDLLKTDTSVLTLLIFQAFLPGLFLGFMGHKSDTKKTSTGKRIYILLGLILYPVVLNLSILLLILLQMGSGVD
jgi:hypothetical protein